MLRLFPKSLLKEPDLLAHKNGLFQEQYRGPNPLLHTCLKRLRALGHANHCLGVCRLALGRLSPCDACTPHWEKETLAVLTPQGITVHYISADTQ